MSNADDYVQLADFLRERGHTESEITRIVTKVKEYEEHTQLNSVMDSVASGHLDLNSLINEALGRGDGNLFPDKSTE
jgi:hypothetical protein